MTSLDLPALLDLAERAALRGGRVVLAGPVGRADRKGRGDYVTEVDRASEAEVAAALSAGAPGIPVRGEEGGGGTAERYWLLDPLDGTTNFLHGFPVVGVSVALVAAGRPVLGVVHAPFLDETYRAARGLGASLVRGGGPPVPLAVSGREPAQAVVGTGFPFRRQDLLPRYLRMVGAALERFEDLRRPGAASLDLAWVASGVFDGFFELALSPWDVAAGAVLIEEAGGTVTDWGGGPGYLSGDILAGPPSVHGALLDLAAATEGEA